MNENTILKKKIVVEQSKISTMGLKKVKKFVKRMTTTVHVFPLLVYIRSRR